MYSCLEQALLWIDLANPISRTAVGDERAGR